MEEDDGLVAGNEVGDASMPLQVIQQQQMLDEASLQQLMDSGTVGEDSIIAFVHNENGESQKVVLSREDTEALKIHLEPQNSVPMEGVEQVPDESLLEMVHEPQQEEQDILPMLMGEPETVPEAPEVIQEPAMEEEPETLALDELPKVDKPQAEPESVPESAGQSTSNDVLSNNIQSLFNPNEPNQSNISVVPRMVGGEITQSKEKAEKKRLALVALSHNLRSKLELALQRLAELRVDTEEFELSEQEVEEADEEFMTILKEIQDTTG